MPENPEQTSPRPTSTEELAAELRARAEKARPNKRIGPLLAATMNARADALDEAASLVESRQEARRVCTCNAIDTPHGPAPDEKTPGCPVHSPAPAEEARAEYDWQRKCPTCGARPTTNCKEPSIYDEARAYREALKAGAATLMEWAPDFLHETASARVREDDEARVSEDDLDVLTRFQRIMRSWNRQHEVEAVDRILAALEPAPPTLKGEDE